MLTETRYTRQFPRYPVHRDGVLELFSSPPWDSAPRWRISTPVIVSNVSEGGVALLFMGTERHNDLQLRAGMPVRVTCNATNGFIELPGALAWWLRLPGSSVPFLAGISLDLEHAPAASRTGFAAWLARMQASGT